MPETPANSAASVNGRISASRASLGRAAYSAPTPSELERRLERAIASLPSASREVLLLVATAGLSPAEAALACGISPEAFRQRLSRARAQLSCALDAESAVAAPACAEVTP